jgi:hypothetical protein
MFLTKVNNRSLTLVLQKLKLLNILSLIVGLHIRLHKLIKNKKLKITSGSKYNPRKELVIYQPITWDLIYIGAVVNHLSMIVTDLPA